ncbi:uncharacterized protein KY384_002609 [Bacidia gigantensis]|uniref:uncharacterized protein n=1 Tax=Bacidia gigantensis TaxID=2732470 RepID=UPI001D059C34|nr:uncharacterized protein KY384_002609 [Bacidia gigantensis]KAG8532732.1 hypothetical protein KY384_002609 [Bacidia gigantensis]
MAAPPDTPPLLKGDEKSSDAETPRHEAESNQLPLQPDNQGLDLKPTSTRRSRLPAPMLEQTKSYADGHGFFCHVHSKDLEAQRKTNKDDSASSKDGEATGDEKSSFEVRWDGPMDPNYPKNMSRTRKWVVVYIVSAASTCGSVGDPADNFREWTFYVLIIWSAIMLALIVSFVPETYPPVLLREKAIQLRKASGDERWKAPIEVMERSITQTVITSCYRPFLLLVFEPMCLNLCLFSAILLGVLYLFFGAFEVVFKENHNFELWQIGLTFTGLLFGQLIAIGTDPLWHRNYIRLMKNREKNGGEPGGSEPEYRLPPAILGGVIVPIGLFWFAWTTYSSVHVSIHLNPLASFTAT